MSLGRLAAIGIIAVLVGPMAFGLVRAVFSANIELGDAVVNLAWVIIGGLLAYKVYANRPTTEPYADEKRTLSTKRAVLLAVLLLPASSWAVDAIVLYNEFGASAVKFAQAAVLVGIAAIVYARRPVHWFHEERRPSPGQGWVVRGLHPRDASALINLENPPGRRMR